MLVPCGDGENEKGQWVEHGSVALSACIVHPLELSCLDTDPIDDDEENGHPDEWTIGSEEKGSEKYEYACQNMDELPVDFS